MQHREVAEIDHIHETKQQQQKKPLSMSFVIKSLHTLMSWVLGAQVMMLFGEVAETLEGRV